MSYFDPIVIKADMDYRVERARGRGRVVRRHRTRNPFVGLRQHVARRAR